MNNNESCHKTSINWYPGHMAKTKRENSEKTELPPIFTSPRNLGKKVERVIILYADRSFESYTEL